MNEPAPIELHKALADDTRYRLYRYLRLSGRPVPVRELATRLGLHANTIRPHLRRLVDAGLVASETRRGPSAVGRPQTVYTAVAMDNTRGTRLSTARRHPRDAHDGRARTHRRGGPRPGVGRLPHDEARPTAGRAASGTEPGGASRGPGGGGIRSAVPPPGEPGRSRSPCGAAPSETCSRSTGSSCARCTAVCSRACWKDRALACTCARSSRSRTGAPCAGSSPADDPRSSGRRLKFAFRNDRWEKERVCSRLPVAASVRDEVWRSGEHGFRRRGVRRLAQGSDGGAGLRPAREGRFSADDPAAGRAAAHGSGPDHAGRDVRDRREHHPRRSQGDCSTRTARSTSPTPSRRSVASARTCSSSAARSRWCSAVSGSADRRSRRWGCPTPCGSSPTSIAA